MNHDLYVLRTLARLSRQRKTVDCESLVLRAGGCGTGETVRDDVLDAVARLERDGLIDRTADRGMRLTLCGLAVAVASAQVPPAIRARRALRVALGDRRSHRGDSARATRTRAA